MADDVTPGTADAQPADDIHSALTAAIAESEKAAEQGGAPPIKEAKPVRAEKADAAAAAAEAGVAEGVDAKAEKDATAKTDAEAKPEGEAGADEAAAAQADPTDAEKKDAAALAEITGKWSAKDKETLKVLAPEARELILRRHKEMEAAFTKKTQAIAAFKQEYEPVEKIFEPYRDRMRANGWTPSTLIQAWSNVERRLMEGEGVNVVAGLMKGYKIDLVQVAHALGLRPAGRQAGNGAASEEPPAANGDGAQVQLPPELISTLQNLQTWQVNEDRRRADDMRRAQTSAEARVMTEIETFKSAQDGKGNLLHPHFEDVEAQMTALASAAIAAKQPVPPLKELYETAVWANPSTRDQEIAARDKAQRSKEAADARAKAEAAKKAGSSITGAPGSGQANRAKLPDRSLHDELEAAVREHSG